VWSCVERALAKSEKLPEPEANVALFLALRFGYEMSETPKKPLQRSVAVTSMAVVPQQMQMFTRKAVTEFPQREKTADSLGEVEADDNHRYYIKGDAHGRPVRASEWISTQISESVGIGAPTPTFIERIDGSVVFGSRRIAGVADQIVTATYLTTPTATNMGVPVAGLKGIISSIYALDMFVHNDDRHLGNYLSVDDSGTRRLYAFDFSRACFWKWPWSGFPAVGDNTRKWGSFLRNSHGFDQNSAFGTLDRLSGLAPNAIEGIINQMPTDWLPVAIRAEFIGWWGSNARNARIEELRARMIDGTLL
jgi:hypothetical protein